jgi:hypothetical protein
MKLGTHMPDGERRKPIDIEVCYLTHWATRAPVYIDRRKVLVVVLTAALSEVSEFWDGIGGVGGIYH